MKHRRLHYLPLLILSFSLACSGLVTLPSASPSLAKKHSSQKEAAISQLAVFDSPVMTSYLHPSGRFSYKVPVNWEVQTTPSGVVLFSPDTVVFTASAIHIGYKFSSTSFLNFASNAETTHYGQMERYAEVARREDKSNRFVFVEKTYMQNGIRKLAMSIYRQVGQSIYIVEMMGGREEITASPKYEALFSAFNESIQDQRSPSVEWTAYSNTWKYAGIENDYFMDIPVGWELTDDQSAGVIRTRFVSPDGNAIIESSLLNPGETINLNFAADYALKLLDESYAKGSDDIRVTSEVNLIHRKSEKITWVSRSGGYAGETYFEVRNQTEVFVLTRAWNRLFEDIYAPVVNAAFLSFKSDSSLLR